MAHIFIAGQVQPVKVNFYNTYHLVMTVPECATKRIPVSPSTWRTVHQLRKPGQTYDDVIQELIQRDSEQKLIDETERIMKRGKFVPLSEIKL
ncbi:hypothetical protein [Methanoregula sp.]|jgi:hypothetical protein|uniref:hypothetical protein n=1 Tax=Methanoregula sp. TaxID=2052170 RepID=UPI0035639A63